MEHSKIKRLKLKNFTAFNELEMKFSTGINVFIGDNGTGKTHILKLLYGISKNINDGDDHRKDFIKNLIAYFLPHDRNFTRLINNKMDMQNYKGNETSINLSYKVNNIKMFVEIFIADNMRIRVNIKPEIENNEFFKCLFIPVKEHLEHAPGFRSTYAYREIHFDKTYVDVIDNAFLPKKRELNKKEEEFLNKISEIIGGRIISEKEEFFLEDKDGVKTEFTLLAEGWRKLGYIWLLLQNGLLGEDTILFWDEPEANLNPSMVKVVAELLLELQRLGVQIFIATHNYIVLREIELQKKNEDNIKIFSLYKENDVIKCKTGNSYQEVYPNLISDAYSRIYEQEILKSLGGK